jgi:hypothetical protein
VQPYDGVGASAVFEVSWAAYQNVSMRAVGLFLRNTWVLNNNFYKYDPLRVAIVGLWQTQL